MANIPTAEHAVQFGITGHGTGEPSTSIFATALPSFVNDVKISSRPVKDESHQDLAQRKHLLHGFTRVHIQL